jgi:hypothetical protein
MTGALAFSRGAISADSPSLNDAVTWNNAAITFTGWKFNVTNTAANSNSNLYNFQVGGEDRANFTLGGVARFIRHEADDTGQTLFLRKRGATGNVDGPIANDAGVGLLSFSGWDGSANFTTATISAIAEETFSGTVAGSSWSGHDPDDKEQRKPLGYSFGQLDVLNERYFWDRQHFRHWS